LLRALAAIALRTVADATAEGFLAIRATRAKTNGCMRRAVTWREMKPAPPVSNPGRRGRRCLTPGDCRHRRKYPDCFQAFALTVTDGPASCSSVTKMTPRRLVYSNVSNALLLGVAGRWRH
jgi:hypothetical protein